MKMGCKDYLPVADQHSKILDTPPGVQILLISCSFSENLAKSYVGASPPSHLPRGNPGSTTNDCNGSLSEYNNF